MAYSLSPFDQLCFDGRMAMTMTKRELAKMIGTSPLEVSRIERGEKEPSAHYVVLVMGILGLDQLEVEAALSTPESPYKLTRIAQPQYGAQQ